MDELGMRNVYQRMSDDIRTARQRMADLRATADSDDGLVSATVGSSGELVELWLDPRVHRNPDTARLAATITDTVRRAAERAAEQACAVLAAFLPPGSSPDTADLRWDPLLTGLDRAAGGERR